MSHALPNIGKVATKALQTIDVTQLEPSYLKASGFRGAMYPFYIIG